MPYILLGKHTTTKDVEYLLEGPAKGHAPIAIVVDEIVALNLIAPAIQAGWYSVFLMPAAADAMGAPLE